TATRRPPTGACASRVARISRQVLGSGAFEDFRTKRTNTNNSATSACWCSTTDRSCGASRKVLRACQLRAVHHCPAGGPYDGAMRLVPFVKFRRKSAAILDAAAVAAASGADCVMVIDGHSGLIERADAAAHRMFGWPEGALRGMHVNELIPQIGRASCR